MDVFWPKAHHMRPNTNGKHIHKEVLVQGDTTNGTTVLQYHETTPATRQEMDDERTHKQDKVRHACQGGQRSC